MISCSFRFTPHFPDPDQLCLVLPLPRDFQKFFIWALRSPGSLWGAPLKWREGVGVYGALGLPCFNQSCSMYWGWKSLKPLLWPLSYILKHLSCCPSPPKRHVGNDFSKIRSPSSWALTTKHPAQCFVPSRSVCSGYLWLVYLIDWLTLEIILIHGLGMLLPQRKEYMVNRGLFLFSMIWALLTFPIGITHAVWGKNMAKRSYLT